MINLIASIADPWIVMLWSPVLFRAKNIPWLLVSLVLLLLNVFSLWLWASYLTLRYQRYLMYLGYLPFGSRKDVLTPHIRHPQRNAAVGSDDEEEAEGTFGAGVDDNLVESFYLTSMDGATRLHAHFYRFPHKGRWDRTSSPIPTILYFHGTSGNIGHRVSYAHTLSSLCQCHVMLLNCRGYGMSEGTAHRKGIQEDSQAALNYLLSGDRKDVDGSRIFVLGQSMGGAIAIDLAMRNLGSIRGMIIDNTFTRMKDLVPEILPPFSPVGDYISEDWDSLGAIEEHDLDEARPGFPHCIFLIGEQDELIDSQHGKQLYAAASRVASKTEKEVRLVLFPLGYHVHTFKDPFYFDSIAQFVDEVSRTFKDH